MQRPRIAPGPRANHLLTTPSPVPPSQPPGAPDLFEVGYSPPFHQHPICVALNTYLELESLGDLGTLDDLTWTSNVSHAWEFEDPGPNSSSGATRSLGDGAAVVILTLLWEPSHHSLWSPARQSSLTRQPPTRWHDDAQNPGWRFRERKLCLGRECVSIVEWHGPSTSRIENDRAGEIASSVRLFKDTLPIK
jgi:hypothetical protein